MRVSIFVFLVLYFVRLVFIFDFVLVIGYPSYNLVHLTIIISVIVRLFFYLLVRSGYSGYLHLTDWYYLLGLLVPTSVLLFVIHDNYYIYFKTYRYIVKKR